MGRAPDGSIARRRVPGLQQLFRLFTIFSIDTGRNAVIRHVAADEFPNLHGVDQLRRFESQLWRADGTAKRTSEFGNPIRNDG